MLLLKIKKLSFVFLFSIGSVFSQNVMIRTDKEAISLGESFTLDVVIKMTGGDISGKEIEIPGLHNFQVGSTSQQSQMKVINGEVEREIMYRFGLLPLREGSNRIGPLAIGSGVNDISNEITIEVMGTDSLGDTLGDQQVGSLSMQSVDRNYYYFLGVLLVCFFFLFYFGVFQKQSEDIEQRDSNSTDHEDDGSVQPVGETTVILEGKSLTDQALLLCRVHAEKILGDKRAKFYGLGMLIRQIRALVDSNGNTGESSQHRDIHDMIQETKDENDIAHWSLETLVVETLKEIQQAKYSNTQNDGLLQSYIDELDARF